MKIDSVSFPVEAGKLREFARAVGGDPETVPLTFTAVAGHWRDSAAMVDKLGLDIKRVVMGGNEWEHHAPVAVGDTLSGDRLVVSDERRKNGTLRVVALETELRKDDGTLAVTQRETIIELPPR